MPPPDAPTAVPMAVVISQPTPSTGPMPGIVSRPKAREKARAAAEDAADRRAVAYAGLGHVVVDRLVAGAALFALPVHLVGDDADFFLRYACSLDLGHGVCRVGTRFEQAGYCGRHVVTPELVAQAEGVLSARVHAQRALSRRTFPRS